MKLTNPEKLILVMLSNIQEKFGIENNVDTKLLKSAIEKAANLAVERDCAKTRSPSLLR